MSTIEATKRSWTEIDDDGTFYRCGLSREPIGTADDMLMRLASDSPMTIKAVADPKAEDGSNVVLNLAIKGGQYHIWGIVPYLQLNCGWNSEKGVLTPIFNHSDSPIQLSLRWSCPDAMKIYFLVLADKPNSVFRKLATYLVALSTNSAVKGWKQLPLANTHDEGKLCLGPGDPKSAPSIASMWLSTYNHFSKAGFNSDLAMDHIVKGSRELFKFDASTNKQLSVPDNWHAHCHTVNSSVYQMIQP